jgi:hypothetical protein
MPGSRGRRLRIFPGRARDDSTPLWIRDTWSTQRLKVETAVVIGTTRSFFMGTNYLAARSAHMAVVGYNPDDSPIAPGVLDTLLTSLEIIVLSNFGRMLDFQGQPRLGIPFNVDLIGGERIDIVVDNSDPRTTLNGQTLVFQLFINGETRYGKEMARKGNPNL